MTNPSPDLRALFCEAIEKKSPEELREYLDAACADNLELRAQLEELLVSHGEAGEFLGGSMAGEPTWDLSSASELPRLQIGPYKLLQQIGEGGMGVVYMAEQTQPVRRLVALKVIKPGMDSHQVIARFEAERQALAMMDHVNIARVLDAGTIRADPTSATSLPDLTHGERGDAERDRCTVDVVSPGRPYFVMELVHGVPITQYCDDNRLTPRERLALFVPVCHAVQHAHQKGIIHRDIKPSNVMVTLYDGKPVPKVIDFGVAKAIEQKLTERTLFTQYGTMVGTLEYTSPEQAEMSALGVDTRSDIYSLGVLLYELLTGTTPLSHQRISDAAYLEILRLIREEEPPKPSARLTDSGEALASISAKRQMEPAMLTKLVRGELDWIVMKALEKDRNRRYETANGFSQDIERYLSDEPVHACPLSTSYRIRKFVRRNRAAVLSGVALFALLLLAIVGTTIGMVRALRAESLAHHATAAEAEQRSAAETQRDRAQAAEKLATEEAAIAHAVNDFLQNDLLAEAAPDKNPRSQNVTVVELLGRAADRIDGQFESQPKVEAAILQTIGETYAKLGDYASAQPLVERALDIRQRVLGAEHPDTLTVMNDLAVLYKVQGEYAKAEPLYLEALDRRRRVMGIDHPDTLITMHNLGGLYQDLGEFAKAEPLALTSLEVFRRVAGAEDPQTLSALNNLVALYLAQGQLDKAEPLAVEAFAIEVRALGVDHPTTIVATKNVAQLYKAQGQFTKSEPLYVQTLESCRRVLGEQHPHTIISMCNLATLYQDQGELAKAEPLFVQALELCRSVLGDEAPITRRCLNSLAKLQQAQLDLQRDGNSEAGKPDSE